MIYLYIFEDGTIRQSFDAPTTSDLACIEDGILTVIRVTEYDECQQFDGDGKLTPVEMAKTDSAGTGATAEYFHTT